jgi:hypothetical protein
LYAPSDFDGAAAAGYSVDTRYTLVEQRRYPAALYAARIDAVAQLLGGDQPAQLEAALATILAERRPLAIQFADPDAPALRWLQSAGVGEQLFSDSQTTVWYIAPDAAVAHGG